MKTPRISEAVIRRLPVYLRYLQKLLEMDVKTVSSHEVGESLDMNPAQIRKDLAYFGEFGRKGIGYDVEYLIEKIKQILKLDRPMNVALVGAGHLGIALSNYNRYTNEKLKIVAVFDNDPTKVGTEVGFMVVSPMSDLKNKVANLDISMGIIAVPANYAQQVADQMIEAGIKGILNFAPVSLKVPSYVPLRNADFTSELQSLAYYVD